MRHVLATICLFSSVMSFASEPLLTQSKASDQEIRALPKGTITPTVAPLVDKGWNVWIDGDFIWWKSCVSNMTFAVVNGKTIQPSFPFEPGFKIGTGMELLHDGWDLYFQYTWFHQPDNSKSVTASSPSFSNQAFPFLQIDHPEALSITNISSASSKRSFDFNVLDLELGRDFFISKRLTLRPSFGFKLASIFEKTKISYKGTDSVLNARNFLKQNLNGIGIRGGVDTVWHLMREFGFYGDLAVTALWSDFHNTFSNKVNLTEEDIKLSYAIKNISLQVIPVIEAGVGVSYVKWFKKERYQLFIKAGWEEQIWLSYNNNLVSSLNVGSGNLTLQGLTFQMGFVF